MSPETTDGYEGFVHPYVLQAGVERTTVRFIVRDFVTAAAEGEGAAAASRSRARRRRAARARASSSRSKSSTATCAKCSTSIRTSSSTRAKRSAAPGSTLRERPIRGGTDGSRLSFMGLPTPNLFAGEHNFHSRLEWVSVQDMEKAVEVIVHLVQVWEERS